MSKRGLTPKQVKYCRERAAGKDYAAAYKAAGYSDKAGKKVMRDNAFNMETKNTDILKRIADLQARADAGGIMTRQQRMQLLNDIALADGTKTQDKIRALDQLARMNADYTDRVDVTGNASVTMSYTDRLDAIRRALQDAE